MIISVGIDLVEVERIRAALEHPRIGLRFRERVYTQREIAYCEKRQRGRFQSYAGRFAAKEAVMKALGTGWARGVAWTEIDVRRLASGKPELTLTGRCADIAAGLGVTAWELSITHTGGHAAASAVATGHGAG